LLSDYENGKKKMSKRQGVAVDWMEATVEVGMLSESNSASGY
jgi:hypothetical protein